MRKAVNEKIERNIQLIKCVEKRRGIEYKVSTGVKSLELFSVLVKKCNDAELYKMAERLKQDTRHTIEKIKELNTDLCIVADEIQTILEGVKGYDQ